MKKIILILLGMLYCTSTIHSMEETEPLLDATNNRYVITCCCSKETAKILFYLTATAVFVGYPVVSYLGFMYPANQKGVADYEKYVNISGLIAYPCALATFISYLKKEFHFKFSSKTEIRGFRKISRKPCFPMLPCCCCCTRKATEQEIVDGIAKLQAGGYDSSFVKFS